MASYEILDSQERLDALFSPDEARRVVIFKHSLTCPISSAGLRQYEQFLAGRDEDPDEHFTLIEIQRQRGLSNRATEISGVRHESPQALVVTKGEVEWHASHSGITTGGLETAFSRA